MPLSSADSFIDVEPGEAHFIAISYLKDNGIIDGYDDNSFKPWENINRAETVKMITKASGLYTDQQVTEELLEIKPFTDAFPGEWYTKYLTIAKNAGIISGYENGDFQPEQDINLVESLKILFKSYETVLPLQ